MPKGNPKSSTIATKRYQDRVGIIPKTYKLKRSVVDSFKEACERNGKSQASVLTELMVEYIENR